MYAVEYLPSTQQELVDIISYVNIKLQNPIAAQHLAIKLMREIDALSQHPYAYSLYVPLRPLQHEYRKLVVGNYVILYWVEEQNQKIVVAHIVYGKRQYDAQLF